MPYSKVKNLSLASAVAMTLAIPVESFAAVDMFIKFDGVDGESQDKNHQNWIDVLAWSWGLSSDGGGKSATCVQDISVTKWVDSASPQLTQSIPANTGFATAQLVVRTAGTSALEFLVYNMSDVKLTSVSTGGSGGEDRLTENVSFSFGELTGTYTPQNADGSAGNPSSFVIPGGECK